MSCAVKVENPIPQEAGHYWAKIIPFGKDKEHLCIVSVSGKAPFLSVDSVYSLDKREKMQNFNTFHSIRWGCKAQPPFEI